MRDFIAMLIAVILIVGLFAADPVWAQGTEEPFQLSLLLAGQRLVFPFFQQFAGSRLEFGRWAEGNDLLG